MIVTTSLFVKVTGNTRDHYRKFFGYDKVSVGETIEISPTMLTKNSTHRIEVECDDCGKRRSVRADTFHNLNEHHNCLKCGKKRVNWASAVEKRSDNHYYCHTGSSHWNFREDKSSFQEYKRSVYLITRQQPINTLEHYDKKRGRCGVDGAYQLDHITSIKEGFEKGIDPSIIGNIANLRFIPWEENLRKWYK